MRRDVRCNSSFLYSLYSECDSEMIIKTDLHCNYQLMPTLALLLLQLETTNGRPRRTWFQQVEENWGLCWSRHDHKSRSLIAEIGTTLSWSSAAVSEWQRSTFAKVIIKSGTFLWLTVYTPVSFADNF